MACIICGFEDGHDADCPNRPPAPATDQDGNELSSREDAPAPKPVGPSLTPGVEESLAVWRAASQMVDAIRAQQFELQAMYDKAYAAREEAAVALKRAMDLRDAGVDA